MSDLEIACSRIRSAKHPEDVLGEDAGAVRAAFGALLLTIHPDKHAGDSAAQALAKEATRLLTDFKQQAEAKIEAGTYGDRTAKVPDASPAARAPVIVRVGRAVYTVREQIATGDICDLYDCDDGGSSARVFKVARARIDNDLVQNEAAMLSKLHPPKERDEGYLRFIPKLVDSFGLKGSKSARRVNVLPRYPEHVTLAQVKAAYPDGLDFRDMVWMFKRTLMALGYIHKQGVVHGAILPEHVLVHPTEHGAKLVDWCYAVPAGSKIKAASPGHERFYAPEVLAKQPAGAGTDVYMAAQSMLWLLSADSPPRIVSFLKGCLMARAALRPQAWQLLEELDALLLRLVGKPKYRALAMPAGSHA